ncbi:lipopolysaccharide biosynthesis protein [Methanotorris igneus]|uniref:Polysaccharide biosynthesis protein n=1 Tax=Methanotorris igneus (strain DSM 5666 / JCM 11834 / Kol 5) TaxID=880724 RepID=F6BAB4_METIK|nr:oligosaccharide flippase family protein [Methanotorris igneus]AEF95804.1 polysaccharide biosynthesis protein [Methanotorris igneus Kol 5]
MFKKQYSNLKDKIYKFSKRYSSKVGLDLPYFIKGGFWLSIGQFFGTLKGFILSIVFANFLSKEVFGQYSFIMTILSIATIFALLGMSVAVIQAVAKGYEGTYFRALKEIFKWSWLGSLFLLGFSVYEYLYGWFHLSLIFLILSSIFPFYAISGFYTTLLNGKKRFDILTKLSSLFNIISTILIVLTAYFTESVFWITIITVLIQIVINGYYSMFYVKRFITNNNIDEDSIKFGKSISLSIALSNIANNFDSMIIAYFLSFEELAIFKIVTSIPNQIKILAKTFIPMILPKIASEDLSKRDIMKHLKKFFVVVVFLIVVYLVLAPFIFKWFYPKYYDYVWLSMLFHLSFLSMLYILPYNYLIKEKEARLINKFYTYSSLILILLSFFGIYFYGLLGAIIARIFYRLLVMIITFLFFLKYCK